MQSIPGCHNKANVEIFCYTLSTDDNTSFRRKIQEESEHFVDLSKVGGLCGCVWVGVGGWVEVCVCVPVWVVEVCMHF